MGALGPVISKDFVYISKIFKDDRELTPEEMSTMVDVRAEGCGAPLPLVFTAVLNWFCGFLSLPPKGSKRGGRVIPLVRLARGPCQPS